MSETIPTLVLIIPEHHDLDPEGVDDLWRHVRATYGAELSLVRSRGGQDSPGHRDSVVPMYCGPWRWDGPVSPHDDLWKLIQRTTFTLDWLEGVS